MIVTRAHTLLQVLFRAWWPHPSSPTFAPSDTETEVRQIRLLPGETVQLEAGEYRLRVLSGRIWLAYAGRERILYAGEALWIKRSQIPVALWTLMQQPALVEWRKL